MTTITDNIKILKSYKEVDKNHLWLRPYLDRDGYELLYFGANGWTPLISCGCNSSSVQCPDNTVQDGVLDCSCEKINN